MLCLFGEKGKKFNNGFLLMLSNLRHAKKYLVSSGPVLNLEKGNGLSHGVLCQII